MSRISGQQLPHEQYRQGLYTHLMNPPSLLWHLLYAVESMHAALYLSVMSTIGYYPLFCTLPQFPVEVRLAR